MSGESLCGLEKLSVVVAGLAPTIPKYEFMYKLLYKTTKSGNNEAPLKGKQLQKEKFVCGIL